MTGVCGGVGEGGQRAVETLADELHRFGDETDHRVIGDDAVALVSHHEASQPVEAADGTLLWCWGQVFGHGPDYASRHETHPNASPTEFCRDIYDRDGFETVADLNGEYALLAYHPEERTIRIVTDRLGTHPIYWARTDDGDVVFCSSLQDLAAHPDLPVAFDRPILYEYFAFRRTFGLRTPIEGVSLAHPGAITTIDCEENAVETDVCWRPEHDAGRTSRGASRRDYVERFRAAVADREAAVSGGRAAGGAPGDANVAPSADGGAVDADGAVDATRAVDAGGTADAGKTVGDHGAESIADAGVAASDGRTGVLISGGNDSRAILAALDDPPVGFHVTSDESATETRVAKQVLAAAGAETRLLRRDGDYLDEALDRNAALCDFRSWFNQAHVYDFAEEIRSGCDLCFTGLYGDVYSGGSFPTHSVPTPLGDLPLPVLNRPESVEEYLEFYLDGTLDRHSNRLPEYCRTPPTARSILAANVGRVDGEIDHHGVRYRDPSDLLFSAIYPVTNRHSFLFYTSMCQMMPTVNPHFDYRLLDWLLAQPLGRLVRMDVQNEVLRTCAPELAEIPHASRGVAPRRSFPVQYASHRLQGGRRRIRARLSNSETRGTGFTTNLDEVLRSRPIVTDRLRRHQELLDRYDWLDPEGIRSEYAAHRDGEHRRSALLCLLTFLAMPIHEHVGQDTKADIEPDVS